MLSGWYKPAATARGTAATDTEALQTDVMRFIAIIGLCLTAIFSLMRSIAEPVENDTNKAENEMLKQQLSLLQEKTTREQQSIQALEKKLSSGQVRLALVDRQENELRQLRHRLSGLNQALNHKKQDQLRLEQKLVKYSAETHSLKHQLTALQHEALSAQHERPPAPSQPKTLAAAATAPKELKPVPMELKPLPRELVESLARKTEPVPGKPKTAPVKPVQQGLVLKFASEQALSELIDRGQVKLLAVAGRQAWQLSPRMQRLEFQKTAMPDKYYEMLSETLPYRYQRAFYSSVKQADSAGTLWAVQIPLSTERQVQKLLQTASAGELIIGANGRVSLSMDQR